MWRPQIKQFEIVIYKNQADNAVAVYKANGDGKEWQDHTDIYLSGFNSDSVVNLQNEWNHVIKNRLNEYKTNITTCETIRKFGEAMQLKTEFEIYFSVQYRQE
jgi:hypothetical protein